MTLSPEVEVPVEGDDVVNDYIAKYSNWGRWGATQGAPATSVTRRASGTPTAFC
jgi:hypothetical protein